jgi:hypothetical protein
MKKWILAGVIAASWSGLAFGQAMAEPRSLDAIVADIEKQQNVTTLDKVAADKVAPAVVEELGDAVMEVMIGNSAMHDRMDKMIGGDGSPQLNAFHTDLGLQYLRNGGIEGVRFGGNWGVGRLGMMRGWGNGKDWSQGQPSTMEGKLTFVDGNPALQTKTMTYLLGFPDFYYYAYTNNFKKDDGMKIEGYLFAPASDKSSPYLAVSKATVNGKAYDFSGSQGMMGRSGGMMGGRGMMGGSW